MRGRPIPGARTGTARRRNEVTRERAQSFLTDDHIDRIVQTFRALEPEEGFAAVETLDAIAEQNGNLSIPLYVDRMGAGPESAVRCAVRSAQGSRPRFPGSTCQMPSTRERRTR